MIRARLWVLLHDCAEWVTVRFGANGKLLLQLLLPVPVTGGRL
jgi:hypothetical protein